MSHKKHLLLLTLLSLVFLPGIYFSAGHTFPASAQTAPIQLSGWAWSSNVGWISFNPKDCTISTESNIIKSSCGGDGVKTMPSGWTGVSLFPSTSGAAKNLVGYAWNPDMGYVYFGPANISTERPIVSNILPAGATDTYWARLSGDAQGSKIMGWARACSVFVSGCSGALKPEISLGGWDGWIKMSDTNYGASISRIENGHKYFDGFVWGGGRTPTVATSAQFPGWIDFSYLTDSAGTPVTPPGGGGVGGCTGPDCIPCTSNCGPVTTTPVSETPFSAGICEVVSTTGTVIGDVDSGSMTITPPGSSITFGVNPEGGSGAYTIKWFNNDIEILSAQNQKRLTLPNLAANSTHKVLTKIITNPAGSNTEKIALCTPAATGLRVLSGPAQYVLTIEADPMATKFTSAASSDVLKSGTTNTKPIIKIGSFGTSACTANITLSIEKIVRADTTTPISTAYYSGYTFSPKPLTSAGYASGSTLNMMIKKQPAGLPQLRTGNYLVTVKGVPVGNACGGEFKKDINLNVSSSGGTYIEL